jgi:pimeloyl-ACP methyl ester carboxylesterase
MRSKTHRLPGLVLTDHKFKIPLNHNHPSGENLSVFAREVVAVDKEKDDLPWMLFLQGGPGFGAPRPDGLLAWLNRALKEYRVLLLDQRGTGGSTPVLPQTFARLSTPQAQADYLKHFRADAIVRDAEWIRRELVGVDQRWSVLGQSYGGFCAVHYLSAAPQGLREVIFTGGLPPLTHPVDDIYRATYKRVIQKNQEYFSRYPGDMEMVQEITAFLRRNEVYLPAGGRLTPRRFQQLGTAFGASDGFEQVHYLLEEAFVRGARGLEISYPFLRGVENAQPFDIHPIYALLHEAIYCQEAASNWSAERVRSEYPQFEISTGQPVYFTGEMIYPWMFDDYKNLQPFKDTAQILAEYENWPVLYDLNSLNANQVPCVAAIYYNDMYVERIFSEQTASEIKGLKAWITNQHEHSALRIYGEELLDHLLGMLRGER